MSRVTVYCDDARVGEHVLMRAVMSLGRHPDNDIVLEDISLSRFHARIERRGDRYFVVDLGSQNGVFLNGVRIAGEAVIRPGDRMGLGRYLAVFDEGVANSQVSEAPGEDSPRITAVNAATGLALRLIHNGVPVARYPLRREGVVIGRSHQCDVVIGLLALSRRHARVFQGEDDFWYVEDLGSQNGTYINDVAIDKPTRLSDGHVINFFEYSLVLESVTAPDRLPSGGRGERANVQDASNIPTDVNATIEEGAASWEERNVTSDVIELSYKDVEDLSSGFEPAYKTRSDRRHSLDRDVPVIQHTGQTRRLSRQRAELQWPTSVDIARALAASQQTTPGGRLRVEADGKVLQEVMLSPGVFRVGSDKRCEISLPPLPGIAPWHLSVAIHGRAVFVTRVGDVAAISNREREMAQAFLSPGDSISVGRVTLSYLT